MIVSVGYIVASIKKLGVHFYGGPMVHTHSFASSDVHGNISKLGGALPGGVTQ